MLLSYLLVQIKSFSITGYYKMAQNMALELELWIELKQHKIAVTINSITLVNIAMS